MVNVFVIYEYKNWRYRELSSKSNIPSQMGYFIPLGRTESIILPDIKRLCDIFVNIISLLIKKRLNNNSRIYFIVLFRTCDEIFYTKYLRIIRSPPTLSELITIIFNKELTNIDSKVFISALVSYDSWYLKNNLVSFF